MGFFSNKVIKNKSKKQKTINRFRFHSFLYSVVESFCRRRKLSSTVYRSNRLFVVSLPLSVYLSLFFIYFLYFLCLSYSIFVYLSSFSLIELLFNTFSFKLFPFVFSGVFYSSLLLFRHSCQLFRFSCFCFSILFANFQLFFVTF